MQSLRNFNMSPKYTASLCVCKKVIIWCIYLYKYKETANILEYDQLLYTYQTWYDIVVKVNKDNNKRLPQKNSVAPNHFHKNASILVQEIYMWHEIKMNLLKSCDEKNSIIAPLVVKRISNLFSISPKTVWSICVITVVTVVAITHVVEKRIFQLDRVETPWSSACNFHSHNSHWI